MLKTTITVALLMGSVLSHSVTAATTADAPSPLEERNGPLTQIDTLKLCIDYNALTHDDVRKQYKKELDFRAQLSTKDHTLVDQNKVENSMTRCGMYMALGKPLKEQTRQIRPMTFKTVHVYPNMYYVSQSGMIVETLERKEGVLPPKLVHAAPKVVPPPVAPK